MDIILSPCPFCGNSKPELVSINNDKKLWRVGCPKCGSSNNVSISLEKAVERWNTRYNKELEILLDEREKFIAYTNTLPNKNRPVLVGPIQIAKWHLNQLEEYRAAYAAILDFLKTMSMYVDIDIEWEDFPEKTLCMAHEEIVRLNNILLDIANMPEYDQDDAHRLRHKAKEALK